MRIEYVTEDLEVMFIISVVKDIHSMVYDAVLDVYGKNKKYDLKIYFTTSYCYVLIDIESPPLPLTTFLRKYCRGSIYRELKDKYNVITNFSTKLELNAYCITTLDIYDFSNVVGYSNLEVIRLLTLEKG